MNKIIPGDIEGTVKNLTEGKRNAVVVQIEDHNGAWEGNHLHVLVKDNENEIVLYIDAFNRIREVKHC